MTKQKPLDYVKKAPIIKDDNLLRGVIEVFIAVGIFLFLAWAAFS